MNLRRRTYHRGTGILTRFPFAYLELRIDLGSTNPQLTNIAEETSPLRRTGFSPVFAATTSGILNPERSTSPHRGASARTGRLSTIYLLRYLGYR